MDTIANMLTSIRNAQAVRHDSVVIPYSKVNFGILQILKREEWVGRVELKKRGQLARIIVTLRYNEDGSPVLNSIQRISKPGKRIYVKRGDIPYVRSGYGSAILSTPLGIMTNEEARKKKVGGEVLCKIW